MSFHSLFSTFAVFVVILSFASLSYAQTNKIFQWQFDNDGLSTDLPTCLQLKITAKPFNITANTTNGVPPFYMTSFAIGGTPQTHLIGTDASNLNWEVTHAPGTRLILQVVDANGSAGGIPPRIFNVTPGQNTQCVIAAPKLASPFTVSANVTGSRKLDTCQPWGITIRGGNPPYSLTLVQPNSPITTNVSIVRGDDVFTYINRANPNSELLAAVSDLNGNWATGTPLVETIGTDPDPACTGLNSLSSKSTSNGQQPQSAAAANQQRTTAIAVSLTLTLLALGCIALSVFICTTRRKRRRQLEREQLKPSQFILGDSKMSKQDLESGPAVILSITRFLDADDHEPVNQNRSISITSKKSQQTTWQPPAKNSTPSPIEPTSSESPISHSGGNNRFGAGVRREVSNIDLARPSNRDVQDSNTLVPKDAQLRSSSFSKFPVRSIRTPSKLQVPPGGLDTVREADTQAPLSNREPPPPPYR